MEDNINIQEFNESLICISAPWTENIFEIRSVFNPDYIDNPYFKVVYKRSNKCCRILFSDLTILENISDIKIDHEEFVNITVTLTNYDHGKFVNNGKTYWSSLIDETNKSRLLNNLQPISIYNKYIYYLLEYPSDSTMYWNNDIRIDSTVNTDYINNPYFKVSKRVHQDACRVSFIDLRILEDISDFIITEKQLSEIINILKSKREDGYSYWELLVNETNNNRIIDGYDSMKIAKQL